MNGIPALHLQFRDQPGHRRPHRHHLYAASFRAVEMLHQPFARILNRYLKYMVLDPDIIFVFVDAAHEKVQHIFSKSDRLNPVRCHASSKLHSVSVDGDNIAIHPNGTYGVAYEAAGSRQIKLAQTVNGKFSVIYNLSKIKTAPTFIVTGSNGLEKTINY